MTTIGRWTATLVGIIPLLTSALWAVQAGAEGQKAPKAVHMARATIKGCTDDKIGGTATLKEEQTTEGIKQVEIVLNVQGLKDGKHAVHIHEAAACQPCAEAKGHHDPGPFGKSTPDAPDFNHPFHMGDLVNIEIKNGQGTLKTTTQRITLSSGRLSVFDENGSSFIIHTQEDLYCDQEDELKGGCAGGPRDACGIIEPAKE